MDVSVKLWIYIHSTKLSFENNILYQSLRTCLIASLVTNSLLNLTYQCNITYLNWMNQAKSSVSLLCPLANTNINDSPWDSNVLLTLPSKSWKRCYAMMTTPASTLTILVPSPSPGNTTYCFLTKSFIGWKPTTSLSTC
ncbi:hypothetical protein ACHAXS_000537 [Conticribra weissflogii]